MTNKKAAIELSMSTIITLVITIIVFTMLLNFGFRMLGFGEQQTTQLLDKYEQQKFEATCDNTKVCIETTKTVTNEDAVFYMRISNIDDQPKNFNISVESAIDDKIVFDDEDILINKEQPATKVIIVKSKELDPGDYPIKVMINKGADPYFSKYIYLYVE